MSSPFSKSMSDTLSRLTEQLGTTVVPIVPRVESQPSIFEPEVVANVIQKPKLQFLTPYKVYLNSPMVIFITCFVVVFSAVVVARPWIWKDKEDRPSILKVLLFVLLGFVPIFFWMFFRK